MEFVREKKGERQKNVEISERKKNDLVFSRLCRNIVSRRGDHLHAFTTAVRKMKEKSESEEAITKKEREEKDEKRCSFFEAFVKFVWQFIIAFSLCDSTRRRRGFSRSPFSDEQNELFR